MKCRTRG